ncbi:hypothetical protein OAL27_03950 [Verrucomicrobiales bacterium]|jgi:hypothetical protein|nr:hypothetical protein [Verrucomicrobiales bacterium]
MSSRRFLDTFLSLESGHVANVCDITSKLDAGWPRLDPDKCLLIPGGFLAVCLG